jgi:hypothetical protein
MKNVSPENKSYCFNNDSSLEFGLCCKLSVAVDRFEKLFRHVTPLKVVVVLSKLKGKDV